MADVPIIGGAGVAVTPDATDFWKRFEAQTGTGANEAGRKAGRQWQSGFNSAAVSRVRVGADTRTADAEVAQLRAEIDKLQANVKVKVDKSDTDGLRAALTALAPAVVPLAGAAAAGAGALALLGATGILAIKGIQAEMKAGTATGIAYSTGIASLKTDLSELEQTSAKGVLGGFEDSAAKIKMLLPGLNSELAQSSKTLGDIGSHAVGGVASGFQTFAPVIQEVLDYADTLSAKFEGWADGPGGSKFAETLYDDFKQVAPILGELAVTAEHLVEALAPSGGGALSEISLFSGLVNEIPVDILKAATTAYIAFRGAVAITAGLKAATVSLEGFATAEVAAGTGASVLAGGRIASLASGAAGLIARLTPAIAVVAGLDIAANSLIKTNNSWAQSNNAVESTIGNFGTALKSVFSGDFTDDQVQANLSMRDLRNEIDSTSKSYDTLRAAQIANSDSMEGFYKNFEPVAAANIAQLTKAQNLFAVSQGLSSTSLSQSVQNFDAYNTSLGAGVTAQQKWLTQGDSTGRTINGITVYTKTWDAALQASNGDLGAASVLIAGHADALADDQAALSANSVMQQRLTDDLAAVETQLKLTGPQVDQYGSLLGITGDILGSGQLSQKAFIADIKAVSTSLAQGDTALTDWAQAAGTFQQAADTAASRGQLIGAALKAANGDALSYQQTMVSVATANQQTASDFANVGKKIIDLKTGTIDYHNAAAAPLINDLNQQQTAAVNAAAAVYQHETALGTASAATDAFNLYTADTRTALDTTAQHLGLTKDQAKALGDEYFGIKNSGDLKKQISLLGNDKVQTALDGILKDLDVIATPFKIPAIDVSAPLNSIGTVHTKYQNLVNYILSTPATAPASSGGGGIGGLIGGSHAGGGGVQDGWFTVGEKGWELGRKSGDNVTLFSNAQSQAMTGWSHVPGFAGGTGDVGYDNTARDKIAERSTSSGSSGGFTGVNYTSTTAVKAEKAASAASAAAAAKAAKAALAADTEQKALIAASAALQRFTTSATSATSTLSSASSSMLSTAKSAKITTAELRTLTSERTTLLNEATARDAVNTKLTTAKQTLQTATTNRNNLASSVKSAVNGGFDISSAGTGFDGQQKVTGGNILAEQQQEVNKINQFYAGINKLNGKVNTTYLENIAQKGPDALPEVLALESLSSAQLKQLNANQSTINSRATAIGSLIGTDVYGAQITADQKNVNALTKQLTTYDAAIAKGVAKMSAQLEAYLKAEGARPVELVADGKALAKVVNTANNLAKR